MRSARRLFLGAALGTVLAGLWAVSPACAQQGPPAPPVHSGLTVTLLGTAGGPPPFTDRSQPANLLEVDNRSYLIDAGENVAQQLLRAGVPSPRLSTVFITHLHWDHTLGLGYLMATGWMTGRSMPLPIWGPPGLADFVTREAGALFLSEDIFRVQNPQRPPLVSLYPVHQADLNGPTEIYRDDKVRVTATPNSHFEAMSGGPRSYGLDKSYSYRFDTAYGSVVFSGDTGPSEALTKLAQGADVLITEICDLEFIRASLLQTLGAGDIEGLMTHMRQQHLSPEEVGKMAAKAKVKKIVLTHYVVGRGAFDPRTFVDQIRKFYPEGEIVVGQDLMRVQVSR